MKIVKLQQGTQEWLDFRITRRNASESSVVLGINPYQKPAQLARIKRGEAQQYVNSAMSRGTQYEPEARAWYECEVGLIGDTAVVEIEPYAASLDWWHREKRIVTDFKVPSKIDSDLWQAALRGECPDYYNVQLQHQAALVDADELYLAVYMPELQDGRIIKVERSAKRWAEIQKAWDEFWEMYMVNPLNPDDFERCDEAWFDACERYREAKSALDAAQAKADAIRSELIELAGNQSAKGCGFSLSRIEKATTKWAEVAKALNPPAELVAKYTSKPTVSFTIKEMK